MPEINALGRFPAAQRFYWRQQLLTQGREQRELRALRRISRKAAFIASDYPDLLLARAGLFSDPKNRLR